MDIFKIDAFEYEVKDIRNSKNEYVCTNAYVYFDDLTDPSIYDITSEVSSCDKVHMNGKYYKHLSTHIHDNYILGRVTLKLVLKRMED